MRQRPSPIPAGRTDAPISGVRLPETGFSAPGKENMITLYP
jgi:hypothetical protein